MAMALRRTLLCPLFSALVALPVAALAQAVCTAAKTIPDYPPPPPPVCADGIPFAIRVERPGTYIPPSSAVVNGLFHVYDAAGRQLRNISVNFTIPAGAVGGDFGYGTSETGFTRYADARYATASTGADCSGVLPLFVTHPQTGAFWLHSSAASNPAVIEDARFFVKDASYDSLQIVRMDSRVRFVHPNAPLPGGVNLQIISGSATTPVANQRVLFRSAPDGPSVVFADDAGAATGEATTDMFGVAHVHGVATSAEGLRVVEATVAPDPGLPPPACQPLQWREVAAFVTPQPVQLIVASPTNVRFGEPASPYAVLSAPWLPCRYELDADALLAGAALSFSLDGVAQPATLSPMMACTSFAGATEMRVNTSFAGLMPGSHEWHLLYGAPEGMGTSEARGIVDIEPDLRVSAAGSTVAFGLFGVDDQGSGTCDRLSASAGATGERGLPPSAPPGMELPFGALRVDASLCHWMQDPAPEGKRFQRALIGTGSALPGDVQLWAYGYTNDNPDDHWYLLRSHVDGDFVAFDLIDGGAGDGSTATDMELHSTLALAVPLAAMQPRTLQDMWWAGPAENGWGMSVTQHADKLFAALFVYDVHGRPVWVVMSGGSFSADDSSYQGSLYRPHGSPYFAYDPAAFAPGPAVGTLTLRFEGADTLSVDYVIDGIAGHKAMQRQRFGPPDPMYAPALGDLWWGGAAQAGWGLALAQQNRTLFGVLFTYDSAGDPTWFVAPAVRFSGSSLSSTLYRTDGSPWLGTAYDASKLVVTPVGTLELSLGSQAGSMTFTVDGQSFSQAISRQPF